MNYLLKTTSLCSRPLLAVIGACIVWSCVCPAPGVALAGEVQPLTIEDFSMKVTAGTKVINEGMGTECFPCKIVTEPYEPEFTQAGAHPWGLTETIKFASEELSDHEVVPTRDVKDIVTDIPPGLLGDPQATPRCPSASLLAIGAESCPADTQIGIARLRLFGGKEDVDPIINLIPEAGQSVEFGLESTAKITAAITGRLVHTEKGYQLAVIAKGIEPVEVTEVEATLWGVPADRSHDAMRGMLCETPGGPNGALDCTGGDIPSGVPPIPFVTLPTSCASGSQTATLLADSWQEPGVYKSATAPFEAVTGCNLLTFEPLLEVQPENFLADAPVGLGVNLKVPQPETPPTLATPEVRDTVITLPEGLSINPAAVGGIRACEASGSEGIDIPTGLAADGSPLRPGEAGEGEQAGPDGEPQLAPGRCPDASTVGTVEAETPLLPAPVKGHMYLARPGCGGAGEAPCDEANVLDGTLYRFYMELGGRGALADAGINLKVAGEVEPNPTTGQLTAVFDETPPLPFSELRVRMNGGERAPLASPPACGPARTVADITPWSAPGATPETETSKSIVVPGTPDATPSSFFDVHGCADPPLLNPSLLAGTVTPQAAKFSSFTLNLTRQDREQYIRQIQVHTPRGLLGMLSSVRLCDEADANRGTCPEESRIGTTHVTSGAGPRPYELSGEVYLTEKYGSDPFGISVVTHAIAGPFNLGLIVVRAGISVDPTDSTLTVTTDPSGPHAIPAIVFGVPVRLRRVTVDIDRPRFMFNPTNCAAQQISATVTGSQGATATTSSPFAVTGCRSLAFKPSFHASTSAKTSRRNGASLDVKLTFPKGGFGGESNVAQVKVSLPRQLPSRLTTLQKACPAATFERDPATCAKGSIVGIVRADTPLLPQLPCTSGWRCSSEPPTSVIGPVYFVSHGGEEFPQLIMVLEGDGVRVDLAASTFISKAGITSSTVRAAPDVPVNSFELYLPQGSGSALAANGNLCKETSKLVMPTSFIAQNGSRITQKTKIVVNGCKADRSGSRASGRNRKGG